MRGVGRHLGVEQSQIRTGRDCLGCLELEQVALLSLFDAACICITMWILWLMWFTWRQGKVARVVGNNRAWGSTKASGTCTRNICSDL